MHKILFKYPSRSRPERFFDGLKSIYNNIADVENFHIACTLDTDDHAMNNPKVIERINSYTNISVQWGTSKNKIHAINRDMPDYPWDICVVMSDDMRMAIYGFDQYIRAAFSDGLDWHVHFPDQNEKDKLPVLYIAGIEFYNRFGWIYNPIYKSLFCDTELMEIAKELKKYKYIDMPGLFVHLLAAYGWQTPDQMWIDQQEIGWTEDKNTYLNRKSIRLNDPSILINGII